jgi:hypothetical protein
MPKEMGLRSLVTKSGRLLLLRHADMVNDNAEEERQANGRDHPGTTKVVVHARFVESNQRHKAQTNTSHSGDRKSDDRGCAALMMR